MNAQFVGHAWPISPSYFYTLATRYDLFIALSAISVSFTL